MRFPWQSKPEMRAGYSDALLDAAMSSSVSASGASLGGAIAVLESCVGLWSRALSSAEVSAAPLLVSALDSVVLSGMARGMARRGEWVALIEVGAAGLRLLPASAHEVGGGVESESWIYRLEFDAPGGGMRTRTVRRDAVVHITYATADGRPWQGVSPLGASPLTRDLAGRIEQSLAWDSGGATGRLLPLPDGVTDGQTQQVARALRSGKGLLSLIETTSKGFGQGASAAPRRDLEQQRFGPEIPASSIELRESVRKDILAAYGVPPASQSAASQRDLQRQLISNTIQPIAKNLAVQLSKQLDSEIAFSFPSLAQTDIAAKARAYKAYTDSGLSIEQAAKIVGIEL